jgi:voltage-gated potassium channel
MTDTDERRLHWRRVIFEHDTRAGRAFDVLLVVAIPLSVAVVMMDSLPTIGESARRVVQGVEWVLTALFTVEHAARLWCAPNPRVYARSFFGAVDLLSILPTWISLVFPAGRFLTLIRVLRVLRIFRILKLTTYVSKARVLGRAVLASRIKTTVFLFSVVTAVVVVGSLMFLVEGPEHGFTSSPVAMYWAIVTLTTVGYGDLPPATAPAAEVPELSRQSGQSLESH